MFVKIGDSFINPAAIAMIAVDQGDHIQGIEVRPPNENRCLLVTVSGHKIALNTSPEAVAQSIKEQAGR